jgi:hypothetical protein
MKKKYRRIYALSLVFVFIAVAPILVLYASGFRYDFSDRRIIKTGVLSVDSSPRNAHITVNEKLTGQKTPKVVKNLFPGDYAVKIEKDGFFVWEKTLPVFANQSTTTEKIGLLKTDTPTLVTEEKITNLVFSPNSTFLAYIITGENEKDQLVVKQQSTLRTVLTIDNVGTANLPVFSDNENFVSLTNPVTGAYSRLISTSGKYDILLEDITDFPVQKIFEAGSESSVYAITENGINRIKLDENSIQLLIAGSVHDGLIIGESMYYIQIINETPTLLKINVNRTESPGVISTFSGNGKYRVARNGQNYITVHNLTYSELSLIEIQNQFAITLNKLNPDVAGFRWSPDSNNLLLYNAYEIWVHNPKSGQQELLVRSSSKVQYADWSPDGKWVVYSHEGFIKAIELDGRGRRNTYNLAQTELIPFTVNVNTKVMFYHDSLQNLFRKQLQ